MESKTYCLLLAWRLPLGSEKKNVSQWDEKCLAVKSSVAYECKQYPNQRKALEENAVLVQTDSVFPRGWKSKDSTESVQAYISIFETIRVWGCYSESHYNQSLIYLVSA